MLRYCVPVSLAGPECWLQCSCCCIARSTVVVFSLVMWVVLMDLFVVFWGSIMGYPFSSIKICPRFDLMECFSHKENIHIVCE